MNNKEYVLGFCFVPRLELRSTDPDPLANHRVVDAPQDVAKAPNIFYL